MHLKTSKATAGIKELKPGVVSKKMKTLAGLQKGEGHGTSLVFIQEDVLQRDDNLIVTLH